MALIRRRQHTAIVIQSTQAKLFILVKNLLNTYKFYLDNSEKK
jgi:hypothetical protein